jgi:hypothetical protein
MGMNLYRHLYVFLKGFNQFKRGIRQQKAGHVLDANTVGAHFLEPFCILYKQLEVVHRADSIAKSSLCMTALFFAGFYGSLYIPYIVKGVKYSYYINSIGYGFPYEIFHHVIRVMLVAQVNSGL